MVDMSKSGVNSNHGITSNALIINGHGRKSNRKFNMGGNTIVTPGSLSAPYLFAAGTSWNLEKQFKAGIIKPVENGTWTTYHQSLGSQMPDMDLYPWTMGEVRQFAQRVVSDTKLWSDIDDKEGLYFDRDAEAKLVVKLNNQYKYLNGKEAAKYFIRMNNCSDAEYVKLLQTQGVPLFLYAPQVGKIKPLERTSLSEVLKCVNTIDGDKIVMVAACNEAKENNKTITFQHSGPDIYVNQVLQLNTPIQKGNITASKAQEQFLLESLSSYNKVHKEKGWHRVGDWEIGRSGHSGNVALANSQYQFELDNGKVKCLNKTKGYIKVDPLPAVLLSQQEIKAFIQKATTNTETKQTVAVGTKSVGVSPQYSFKSVQEQFLLDALSKYNNVQKEKGWHRVSDWEIGRSTHSGNVALANSQYQFELEGGKLKCIDKTKGYTKVHPLPTVLLPQQEITQFIQAQAKLISKGISEQATPKKSM